MPYPVAIETVAPAYAAVGRVTCPVSELSRHIPPLCGKAWNFIKANNIPTDGHMIALYRNTDLSAMQVEAGARVLAPFKSTADMACVEIPAGPAAHATFIGPYNQLKVAHDAIIAWLKSNNRQFATCWELYDHPDPDPAKTRTDIYYHLV